MGQPTKPSAKHVAGTALLSDLMRVPPSEGSRLLGQLVATCDEGRAARLEVLRGIRDALADQA